MSWAITGTQKLSWSPANITTNLWLDGSDASTVQLNGSTVSQWTDKSGNSRHATQTTAAIQPEYSNGSIVFTADRLNIAGSAFPGNNTSLIAVCQVSATASGGAGLINLLSNPSDDPELRIGTNQTTVAIYYNGGYAINNTVSALSSKTIICAEFTGDGICNLIVNGNISFTGTRAGNLSVGNFIQLGFYQIVSTYTNGTIWHLLAYPSSTDTRQKLEWWLANKEGMIGSLPANHPYKTTVPVP